MKSSRLTRKFFERPTLTVAKDLIGKQLVRKIGNKIIKTTITETEAYFGHNDLASHASKGKTTRTAVMFGQAGQAYVYLIYGVYHCLNIVTGKDGYPAAVLIRGVELAPHKLNGPGKICRYLHIDRSLNREDLITSKKLWVEEGKPAKAFRINRTPRINVDYAGKYKDKLWRFVLKSKQNDQGKNN